MSTPQRSRYPRPLKATQAFAGGNGSSGQPQLAGTASSQPTTSSSNSTTSTNSAVNTTSNGLPAATNGQTPAATSKSGYNSPPPISSNGSGVKRAGGSPEGRSPVINNRGEGVGLDSINSDCSNIPGPQRSNSMGSLSDPDCYMNSLWPRVTSSSTQCDGEDPLFSNDSEFNFFSHKRSNSCSGADRLEVSKPTGLKGGAVSSAHTRTSIEGLNQEVSSALEGNPILLVQAMPPDGHVAPIRDLLSHASVGTQTPPLSLPIGTSLSSSQSPSPFPTPSSPSASFSHTSLSECTHLGINGSSRESPASFQHPSSPKPSFAREPPDGAERCTIKVETSAQEGFVPRGPDKSKGNIIFKGTAFAPLLSNKNLQPVA